MIVATIVSALACVVLVAAEFRRARRVRLIAKPIASLAFIAVGLLAARGAWTDYQVWIVIGLVLGAVGDVALLGTSSRAFLVGLGAFLFGHVAYIVGFAQLAAPARWLDTRALVPVVLGIGVLAYLWPRLGKLRVPVIAYVVAIVTMTSAALAAARVEAVPEASRVLLAVGAALFFASDFAVARDKFIGHSVTNRAWGLPAYYAGQLLIAWSIT